MKVETLALCTKMHLKWLRKDYIELIKQTEPLGITPAGKYLYILYKDQTTRAKALEILDGKIPVVTVDVPAIVDSKYLGDDYEEA